MTEPTSTQELFKGRHFDQEIIVLCVRWYLTFKLSSRDWSKWESIKKWVQAAFGLGSIPS
jgi:transposase-like protein